MREETIRFIYMTLPKFGLDFGNSKTVLCAADGSISICEVVDGSRITPSRILFQNDTILIGNISDKQNSICKMKEFIRKSFSDHVLSNNSIPMEGIIALYFLKIFQKVITGNQSSPYPVGSNPQASVVLSVPVYFTQAQREYLSLSANLGCLKVIDILNDTTACMYLLIRTFLVLILYRFNFILLFSCNYLPSPVISSA